MSEEIEEFVQLRDKLAQIKGPALPDDYPLQTLKDGLDDALKDAAKLERLARTPANHFDGAMSQALGVIVAADGVAQALKELKDRIGGLEADSKAVASYARSALSEAMHSSGAPDTETETHTADPITTPKTLVVENIADVPMDLIEYVPTVKATEARARLVAGLPVPGMRLADGKNSIKIKAKKVKRGSATG